MSNYRAGDKIDERYLIEKHLGSGGFADVFKAKDEMTGAVVAVKIYNSMDSSGIEIFQKEYRKMSDLLHGRLLTANHFGISNSSPYLVMPLCEHGNLTRLLIDEDYFLSEKQLAIILLQVAEGLEYLHKKGVVHQDIKPDNILEIEEGEYVLSDFGISQRARSTLTRSVRRTEKMGTSESGYTPAYAPPIRERLSTRAEPSKDIFSLGATLYELSARQMPYTDMGEAVQNSLEIPDLPDQYSRGWNDLIQSCLLFEAENRPTATQLKETAQGFLANGNWALITKKESSAATTQKAAEKPEAATIKNEAPASKKRWIGLAAIPMVALLGWGVFQMTNKKEIIDPVPIVEKIAGDSTDVSTKKPKEESKAVAAKEDAKQKEYTDLMASAERNFKRGDYKNALAKFQKAKGIISDDQAAQDGITKSNIKIAAATQKQKPKNKTGSFTDSRDGQKYIWVKMKDGKKWLSKNINYKSTDSWCYDNNAANCNKYGRLYTWQSAKSACPLGWHLPSDNEWWSMLGQYDKIYNGRKGKPQQKADSAGRVGYKALIAGGASGFNAKLGGFRYGGDSGFAQGGKELVFWASTRSHDLYIFSYDFVRSDKAISRNMQVESLGLSCRCVEN